MGAWLYKALGEQSAKGNDRFVTGHRSGNHVGKNFDHILIEAEGARRSEGIAEESVWRVAHEDFRRLKREEKTRRMVACRGFSDDLPGVGR